MWCGKALALGFVAFAVLIGCPSGVRAGEEPRDARAPDLAVIHGRVVDAQTGLPLAGASVDVLGLRSS
jgi:hypothetical protein